MCELTCKRIDFLEIDEMELNLCAEILDSPLYHEDRAWRGTFRLITSGYWIADSCSVPECVNTVFKLVGVDSKASQSQFFRERIEMADSLPPYVIERYVRLLNLWRRRGRTLRTLVDLCLRCLDPTLLEDVLPRRNYVIHRTFRRMLTALAEAERYESIHNDRITFAQYSGNMSSPLEAWMDRNEYLRNVRCPFHRLAARLSFGRTFDYPDEYPKEMKRTVSFPDDELINHFVTPHQCGYTRCTCGGYKDIKRPGSNPSHTRVKELLGIDEFLVPKKEKKVPKAKLQAERANSMKTRAAQRAGRKRR